MASKEFIEQNKNELKKYLNKALAEETNGMLGYEEYTDKIIDTKAAEEDD